MNRIAIASAVLWLALGATPIPWLLWLTLGAALGLFWLWNRETPEERYLRLWTQDRHRLQALRHYNRRYRNQDQPRSE